MISKKTFRSYMSIDVAKANRCNPDILKACVLNDPQRLARSIDERLWYCMREGDVATRLSSLKFCSIGAHESVTGITPAIADIHHVTVTNACRDLQALDKMKKVLQAHEDFVAVGADIAFDAVDHWCAGGPFGRQFGDRAVANDLIGVKALHDAGLKGDGVNVVIVDRGLNKNDIKGKLGGTYGGGWAIVAQNGRAPIVPGTLAVVRGVTNNDHGMMIARNILRVAPKACLYDLPLIPPRILGLPTFLSDAHAAFERILTDIKTLRENGKGEKWIIVNAWAPFDRMSEEPRGDYSENPAHPFLKLIDEMVEENIDIVFAAGNCGQFCPDSRCGAHDVGPGKSIYGANGHTGVLTVGAVTNHPIAIGSSSQGEGQAKLAREKPDLVAPSMFSERSDRHMRNGGTSAACAMAAGVLAALRQGWGPKTVPPADMKQCLRETAKRPGKAGWDPRLGFGVINGEGALKHLAEGRTAVGSLAPSATP